jgi:hypothetical protein
MILKGEHMTEQAQKYNPLQKTKFLISHTKITLCRCNRLDPEFCYYYISHYPNSKGIVGRQFNYKIYDKEGLIGIIGANSPPLNYLKFNEYFEIKNYEKGKTELYWLNNNVFRTIISQKNRGTQILKLFRKQIFEDYYHKYGIFLLGLITFVEPPFNGNLYRGDNWDYLGMTQGISVTAPTDAFADIKKRKRKLTTYKNARFPERYSNRIRGHKK